MNDQYSVHLRQSDGELLLKHDGLHHAGDVLLHLPANGLPMEQAAQIAKDDAQAEIRLRSETDMAAWRIADHLRREELKAQFRQNRKH